MIFVNSIISVEGNHFIGIYPLLENNTSWFLVTDFDKENWKEEFVLFQKKNVMNIALLHILKVHNLVKMLMFGSFFKNHYLN
ncbi:TOTE conflict system archaeo-eukaryotic primase domain-containing protein [Plebeiibacterium marinum]|uniref:TOTE conflict system archaeo-eukaryotic primase domain-containing protein n=1 Tax=Plebeiibacterium marinum TaxID=2992111 RepID=UPI003F4E2214